MNIHDEQQLRTATADLVLGWATDFNGASKEQFATAITAAVVVSDESRHSLQRWIDAGRRAGMSWYEIGTAVGISRQAAQQRFGSMEDLERGADDEIIVFGASAFNEVRLLNDEGAKGNELVRTGFLKLAFRPSEVPWEHARMIAATPSQAGARLEGKGWQYVSSWFPFHYFKRPLQEA